MDQYLLLVSLFFFLLTLYKNKKGNPIPHYGLVFFLGFFFLRLGKILGISTFFGEIVGFLLLPLLLGSIYFLLPRILNTYLWQRSFRSFLIVEEVWLARLPLSLSWVFFFCFFAAYFSLTNEFSFFIFSIFAFCFGFYFSSKNQLFQPLLINKFQPEKKEALINPSWEDIVTIVNFTALKLFGLPVLNKLDKSDYRFPQIGKRYFGTAKEIVKEAGEVVGKTVTEHPALFSTFMAFLGGLFGTKLEISGAATRQDKDLLAKQTLRWEETIKATEEKLLPLNEKIRSAHAVLEKFRFETKRSNSWWPLKSSSGEQKVLEIEENRLEGILKDCLEEKVALLVKLETTNLKLSTFDSYTIVTKLENLEKILYHLKITKSLKKNRSLEELYQFLDFNEQLQSEVQKLVIPWVEALLTENNRVMEAHIRVLSRNAVSLAYSEVESINNVLPFLYHVPPPSASFLT